MVEFEELVLRGLIVASLIAAAIKVVVIEWRGVVEYLNHKRKKTSRSRCLDSSNQ